MKNIKTILLSTILIISVNAFSQIIGSVDESGNLQFKGVIEVTNKSNFELSECISSSAMIMGIESKTESDGEALDSAFVKGEYSYSYYVDDYGSQAGEVKFKFEYIIRDGQINYRFYDFEHKKSESKFASIGLLPKEWNEKVKSSFSKKQYTEIMTDLKLNVANAIRMINKNCVK
ncbi:MAG: hypothetical protein HRT68_05640 [Flavobacteriaceae bacterium]|nr:hypothetical protein [Flavobacteriaceae bacterium]